MAETVFILGAGASAESGAPVMDSFLETAEDLLEAGRFDPGAAGKVRAVLALREELRAVYANSDLDLNNIEKLFGLVEMASLVGTLGSRTSGDIDTLRRALAGMVARTLELAMTFPITGAAVSPPPVYERFARGIKEEKKCAFITFNYDVGLDYALFYHNIPFDYCLDARPGEKTCLLKLHGSINWAVCSQCRQVLPFTFDHFFDNWIFKPLDPQADTACIEFTPRLGSLGRQHAHEQMEGEPVIVPPTWNKTDYRATLSGIWRRAVLELAEARHLYVIGYSFPESDSFFKYLYALGTLNNPSIRRFCVINPDETGRVEERFRGLLGSSVKNRFEMKKETFARGLQCLF